jgi:plastocyanin
VNRRRVVAFALTALAAAGAAGAEATVEVEIKGNLFLPETVTVRAGTTVRWTNKERRTTHSVLFPAESLESERLLPDDSWQRKFDKPGRHPYTCGPHPEMKGLVIVVD